MADLPALPVDTHPVVLVDGVCLRFRLQHHPPVATVDAEPRLIDGRAVGERSLVEAADATVPTCNYSAGAYLTRDNRRAIIEQNKYLERVVHAQQERIIELEDQLAQRPTPKPAHTRAKPAIH